MSKSKNVSKSKVKLIVEVESKNGSQIGLKRKDPSANDDFSDRGDERMSQAVSVTDQDEKLPPLANSAMKELKRL